ncbi:unnamed protein product [Porites evermanni]|uniref:Uncharacterized protein n=1 Tax=Porites evermanni TaxID=104178 RepID=A0ABN8PDW4_9CNID|nr:unnamed protein product [Porites evermanni]
MKKANLKSWKSAWQTNKNKTTCGVAPLKDDRALFARFLVVMLSRPDLDIKETISTFELTEYPRALFFSDGSLQHCATKSKLMNTLESLLPAQQQPKTSTVHVVFDRYEIPNSLKEGTRQKRTGTSRAVKDSQTTYVVTSKGDCIASSSLPIQHLRSEQEEADTRMLLHALDATQRGATSITIQSPDTDVLVLTLWVNKRLCPDITVIVGTGGKRRSIPLGPLYEAVGEELVKALPGFHAFSGCDQTGTISEKANLGTTDTIPDDIYITLEHALSASCTSHRHS